MIRGINMFKIMQTTIYNNYYTIIFTYEDEYFLVAGDYKNDQTQLVILDAIDKKDIKENMLETGYICYYSIFNDVESHPVLEYIDEILSAGFQLDEQLVG